MKKILNKLIALLGPAVVSALGFTSCGENGLLNLGGGLMRCEYGTPNCDFKVDISVVDEVGKPVKGIKVTPVLLYPSDGNYLREQLSSVTTDDSGKATGKANVFSLSSSDIVRIIFEDIDGDQNGGTFAKDSAEFKPVQTGKGDNHWYSGEFTVSGTQKLKKE